MNEVRWAYVVGWRATTASGEADTRTIDGEAVDRRAMARTLLTSSNTRMHLGCFVWPAAGIRIKDLPL